jgi:hypothetical protein
MICDISTQHCPPRNSIDQQSRVGQARCQLYILFSSSVSWTSGVYVERCKLVTTLFDVSNLSIPSHISATFFSHSWGTCASLAGGTNACRYTSTHGVLWNLIWCRIVWYISLPTIRRNELYLLLDSPWSFGFCIVRMEAVYAFETSVYSHPRRQYFWAASFRSPSCIQYRAYAIWVCGVTDCDVWMKLGLWWVSQWMDWTRPWLLRGRHVSEDDGLILTQFV